MKRDDKWLKGLIAGEFVVIALHLSSKFWMSRVCGEFIRPEGANCFEFWLNRYQTLLSGGATLLAGYWAYVAVQKQIMQGYVLTVLKLA